MIDQQSKKIKLCHLTSVHCYNDPRIFLKECCTLVSANYEIHLVAPGAPNEVIKNVQLHSIPKIKENRLLRMTKAVWCVYQIALEIQADIYHFHDPELIPVGILLVKQSKKVIYDVHEDVPRDILSKYWIPKIGRRIISWLVEKLEYIAAKQFTAIVTATPLICDRFLKLGCFAVNVNNYPIVDELSLPNTSWEQKELVVCYVGAITEVRGIFEMIEAIGQTDTFLLLGGKFAYQKQQEKAVAMSGWTNVKELGWLDRKEVVQTIAKSMAGLVLLHPTASLMDSLPVKMFEYMCAGIPVIASNFPLWKEIIEGNQCGICVDPHNPQAIAEAIQWIIAHPYEAKQMGENGRSAVLEKYNWEKESKVLLKLYEDLSEQIFMGL
ncbi:glycosyltransferase family 4 protein [Sphaerospermopsis aphanizomenoides BCCUSP55]|uniref:glycosyltransferase family 4 protein n=1 Tax=Sphaerospermopsis aphanizomenoides TaxID=459663 RepID=UPI001907034E|nr:glycosyltransferase family 4 protein [Sphaerospermopsis aphanizomenoides]MBK1990761.1 glycosyltransferase family 4 protein [Sphaerospermopsis aphanizomenoides BCCUSP55]